MGYACVIALSILLHGSLVGSSFVEIFDETAPLENAPRAHHIKKRSIDLDDITGGQINICFACDKETCDKMSTDQTATDFMKDVLRRAQRPFTASGVPVTFKALYTVYNVMYLPALPAEAYTISDNAAKAQYFNMWFWGPRFSNFKDNGCGAAFFVTDHEYIKYMGGAANLASMCTEYSFGFIRYTGDKLFMGIHLAHELGHLFSMGHDGVLPRPDFLDSRYDEYNSDIKLLCDGNDGCLDGNCRCIMAISLYYSRPESEQPAMFSPCSLAYFKFWLQARCYEHGCLIP